MANLYGLTEGDLTLLKDLISWWRNYGANLAGRPRERWTVEHVAPPETYVAMIPSGGLPALTVTGTPPEYTPGSAVCTIYRLVSGVLELIEEKEQVVYNLSETDLDGPTVTLVHRDKYGTWYTDKGKSSALCPEAGTGINGGVYYTYLVKCEYQGTGTCDPNTGTPVTAGDLNLYRVPITGVLDSNGCLSFQTGAEEFVETIACCDPSCGCMPPDLTCDIEADLPEAGITLYATIEHISGGCDCLPSVVELNDDNDKSWYVDDAPCTDCDPLCKIDMSLRCLNNELSVSVTVVIGGATWGWEIISVNYHPFEVVVIVSGTTSPPCTDSVFRVTFTE